MCHWLRDITLSSNAYPKIPTSPKTGMAGKRAVRMLLECFLVRIDLSMYCARFGKI